MYNIKPLKKIAQKLSLLYVEDDDALRKSTTEIFKSLFKETVVAEDGQVAIDAYHEYFDTNEILVQWDMID